LTDYPTNGSTDRSST